jgi:poly(A) polymerase
VSRRDIWPEALKVIRRLSRFGHLSYLVGGGVRDLALGSNPKDFDVVTDATPEEVRRLFSNSRIIGKRFRLVQVYFKGGRIIEVSTFRRDPELDEQEMAADSHAANNFYGSPYQDVMRRDFTINAMFYDLRSFSIVDYVGGWEDLNFRIIRAIGDPIVRFSEDPIRMTRAVEFAGRLGFTLHPSVEEAIKLECWRISQASKDRLRDEVLGILLSGASSKALQIMDQTGLLFQIFSFSQEAIAPFMDRVVPLLANADVGLDIRSSFRLPQLLSLLIMPALLDRVPLDPDLSLGYVKGEISTAVGLVRKDLLLPAYLVHDIKELMLAMWRIARGPRARGCSRFRNRDCFGPSIHLFGVVSSVFREYKAFLDLWSQDLGGKAKRKASYVNRPQRR